MKGRSQVTEAEASNIRYLQYKKTQKPGKEHQLPIRKQLCQMGFYISDCGNLADFGPAGMTVEDFDRLARSGRIKTTE